MASVEYYFQTKNPKKLRKKLSKELDSNVELDAVSFRYGEAKPDVPSLENWVQFDSYSEWLTDEHRSEVEVIKSCSEFYENVIESHDGIGDSWWGLGQGLDD